MSSMIAFVTFEGPWFPAGGIAAVMGRLPAAVHAAAKVPTIVLSPFHRRSDKLSALQLAHFCDVPVPYGDRPLAVSVFHHDAACPWYFLKPEDVSGLEADPFFKAVRHRSDPAAPGREGEHPRPFFDGIRHPYDLPGQVLLRDSLLFGASVVATLAAIEKETEWIVLTQDWEAATAALAFANHNVLRGRVYLTLHNSYDSVASATQLTLVGIDAQHCPGETVLLRAFPLVRWPLFTVSEQFAADLTEELLQTHVTAPHMQRALSRSGILGIDNGPFKDLAIDSASLLAAKAADFAPLCSWKARRREKAIDALSTHVPTESQPLWGDKHRFRRDASPWFVMAGRDDPRQKGYDVAVAAVEDYLMQHHGLSGCAQFVFFPVPGDEGLIGLQFLKELAERFPEDVLAFPFIWKEGFSAALQGSSYGLMPSLYEPFGMANEFYLEGGCVGIARATGGNVEQIIPLRATAAFSHAVLARACRFHPLAAQPTGILFREKDDFPSASHDWGAINAAEYDSRGGRPSRVEQRRALPLFRAVAQELRIAIEEGARILSVEPELYYRMLVEGVAHIQRSFSWKRAAQEYARTIQ